MNFQLKCDKGVLYKCITVVKASAVCLSVCRRAVYYSSQG